MNPRRRIPPRAGLLSLLALGCSWLMACAASPASVAATPAAAQAQTPASTQTPTVAAGTVPAPSLRQQLAAQVGEARCERDDQCHSLPVGARPCGGPASFLAWSSAGPDAAGLRSRLQRLSAASAEAGRKAQQAAGLMGACQVLPDPGARCDVASQRCVLGGQRADL